MNDFIISIAEAKINPTYQKSKSYTLHQKGDHARTHAYKKIHTSQHQCDQPSLRFSSSLWKLLPVLPSGSHFLFNPLRLSWLLAGMKTIKGQWGNGTWVPS
jgi:hypothetical protein